ncbi:valine--pyruvate transaminase [bacterium]|nr:valine--pyruvate transaminase [bacterium]
MTPRLSRFGRKFTTKSGILELMEDLGAALSQGGDICMLGAGAPAPVPQVQQILRQRMADMLADGDSFDRMLGDYDPPQGNAPFIDALVGLLRREFDWDIGPENVALTNGSQSAFFFLFNMLAGEFDDGSRRRILLPVVPEYIGYADLGLSEDMFVAQRPSIELLGDHGFKYHTDFANLTVPPDTAALCVSRPTNPSGNVLTDDEVRHLARLAAERGIPLICDNAYGAPFPQIIFEDVQPYWDENVIFSMSLSKLGLPAARTGVIVAAPEIVKALAGMTAVVNLATGGIGATLLRQFVETGEVLRISREIIRPFYQERAERATNWVHERFGGKVEYRLHKCEGSMFLWLWFPSLGITTYELYERLKARGVIIVPGRYFFPGLQEPWGHTEECVRINYAHDPSKVDAGLRAIAEEAARASA